MIELSTPSRGEYTDINELLQVAVRESAAAFPRWHYKELKGDTPWITNGTWWIQFSYESRERELLAKVMNQALKEIYVGPGKGVPVVGWLSAYDSCPYIEGMFPRLARLTRRFEFTDIATVNSRIARIVEEIDSKSDDELFSAWRYARRRAKHRMSGKFSVFLNEDGLPDE
ncbi:MAG: hypothetical protein WCK51_07990 [Armatimonadota bacterium]